MPCSIIILCNYRGGRGRLELMQSIMNVSVEDNVAWLSLLVGYSVNLLPVSGVKIALFCDVSHRRRHGGRL